MGIMIIMNAGVELLRKKAGRSTILMETIAIGQGIISMKLTACSKSIMMTLSDVSLIIFCHLRSRCTKLILCNQDRPVKICLIASLSSVKVLGCTLKPTGVNWR